jgi:hypothetical protein
VGLAWWADSFGAGWLYYIIHVFLMARSQSGWWLHPTRGGYGAAGMEMVMRQWRRGTARWWCSSCLRRRWPSWRGRGATAARAGSPGVCGAWVSTAITPAPYQPVRRGQGGRGVLLLAVICVCWPTVCTAWLS